MNAVPTIDPALLTGEIPIPENGQAENPDPLQELRRLLLIDLSRPITEPPAVIEISEDDHYRRFASLGDFSLIIGKAKSRKSFFVCMVVASLAADRLLMDKFNPRLNGRGKKIVVFDTEQSPFDVQTLNDRILKTAGLNECSNLEVYHLRKLDTRQRIELIEYVLYNTPGLLVVVIDGIRDLVTDINSPEEASYIKDKLLKWTEELNIHIVTVLHQNKADNNARGHVGTELINKAETVVSIAKDTKDPALSIVTAEQTRGREFKPFAFLINTDGLPEITDQGIETEATESRKKTIYPNAFTPEVHKPIIQAIFENQDQYKYSDLIEEIKTGFRAYNVNFGNTKAREFLSHWISNNWIEKVKGPGVRWEVYSLTQVR